MQTKFHSLVETITSTFVGYTIAVISQYLIFPLFDIHVSLNQNFIIAAYFTVISLIRSYVIRRWFNHMGSDVDNILAKVFKLFKFKQGGVVPGHKTPKGFCKFGSFTDLSIDGKIINGSGTFYIKNPDEISYEQMEGKLDVIKKVVIKSG